MKNTVNKQEELSAAIMSFLNQPIFGQRFKMIEELTSIPATTLSQTNNGRLIPSKHIYSLICFLAPYGFKLNGYNLEIDEQGNLFGRQIGDKAKTIEVLQFKDGSTQEREVSEVTSLDEDMPSGYLSSSFYDLHRVERVIWTSYSDL